MVAAVLRLALDLGDVVLEDFLRHMPVETAKLPALHEGARGGEGARRAREVQDLAGVQDAVDLQGRQRAPKDGRLGVQQDDLAQKVLHGAVARRQVLRHEVLVGLGLQHRGREEEVRRRTRQAPRLCMPLERGHYVLHGRSEGLGHEVLRRLRLAGDALHVAVPALLRTELFEERVHEVKDLYVGPRLNFLLVPPLLLFRAHEEALRTPGHHPQLRQRQRAEGRILYPASLLVVRVRLIRVGPHEAVDLQEALGALLDELHLVPVRQRARRLACPHVAQGFLPRCGMLQEARLLVDARDGVHDLSLVHGIRGLRPRDVYGPEDLQHLARGHAAGRLRLVAHDAQRSGDGKRSPLLQRRLHFKDTPNSREGGSTLVQHQHDLLGTRKRKVERALLQSLAEVHVPLIIRKRADEKGVVDANARGGRVQLDGRHEVPEGFRPIVAHENLRLLSLPRADLHPAAGVVLRDHLHYDLLVDVVHVDHRPLDVRAMLVRPLENSDV
mmetsp:Transcript_38801/g.121231  ORF Transcript_38801/g.121231 Transcript_38801/m.121231 type:complete len:499 (-) Transcript_38801:196-1692(-)